MSKKYNSVWDAISDTPEEAENMKLRSVFMVAIKDYIEGQAGTQAEKAIQIGLTQPRLNGLLKGRISKFSLDSLVNIAARAGMVVDMKIKAA